MWTTDDADANADEGRDTQSEGGGPCVGTNWCRLLASDAPQARPRLCSLAKCTLAQARHCMVVVRVGRTHCRYEVGGR